MRGRSTIISRLAPLIAVMVAMAGCASPPTDSSRSASPPLPDCTSTDAGACVARLFDPTTDIAKREASDFPARYLELNDPDVIDSYCKGKGDGCRQRLGAVANYFGPRPKEGAVALALEGGGTKAGAFALGTLAGLTEVGLLDGQVEAIASVSGGTYGASYYYNRLFDRLAGEDEKSGAADWFRSCVPEYFINKGLFGEGALRREVQDFNCREIARDRAENNEFDKRFEFIGHVWKNHDLLMGNTAGGLRRQEELPILEAGNVALQLGSSLAMVPLLNLDRTVFRWPYNLTPSQFAYRHGLERQYGFSPRAWKEANKGALDFFHYADVLHQRWETRSLGQLGKMVGDKSARVPRWVVATTAPSHVDLFNWVAPQPRDPLRQQFELTWNGYGSGVYGYAKQAPDMIQDAYGSYRSGMPIVHAVTASAAFFDEDQTRYNIAPIRLAAGVVQRLFGLSWFLEIPNFNTSDAARWAWAPVPWPLYHIGSGAGRYSPYIHLQDGGNTENSGIFPLLRRGYKTIIYAHGTQDAAAKWESVCHLKNQLELDGAYVLDGSELDEVMKRNLAARGQPQHLDTGPFRTYFEGLCSDELGNADRVVFDENHDRDPDKRTKAVARVFCGRITGGDTSQSAPDTCQEYVDFRATEASGRAFMGVKVVSDAFYNWPAGQTVRFTVCRIENAKKGRCLDKPLSTIIVIVPAISPTDVARQIEGGGNIKNWEQLNARMTKGPQGLTIRSCMAPDGQRLSDEGGAAEATLLPCTALARILSGKCVDNDDCGRSGYPQENFIFETLATTYTDYAAQFDLARGQVRNVICNGPEGKLVSSAECDLKPRE